MKEVACGTLVDVQVMKGRTVSAVAGDSVAGRQRPLLCLREDGLYRPDVRDACRLWQDDKFVLFSSGVTMHGGGASGTHDGARRDSSYIDWSRNRWYVTTVQNWVDAGLPAIA